MPGASAYFLGGAVVYTRQARRSLVSIHDAAMAGIRSASEPYAALLARTVRERHGATWGLSETGAAGPDREPLRRPRRAYVHRHCGAVRARLTFNTGSADRRANMQLFAREALETLLDAIKVDPTRHPGRSDASRKASSAPIRDLGRFDSLREVPDSLACGLGFRDDG